VFPVTLKYITITVAIALFLRWYLIADMLNAD
jgi:hypothetical protein